MGYDLKGIEIRIWTNKVEKKIWFPLENSALPHLHLSVLNKFFFEFIYHYYIPILCTIYTRFYVAKVFVPTLYSLLWNLDNWWDPDPDSSSNDTDEKVKVKVIRYRYAKRKLVNIIVYLTIGEIYKILKLFEIKSVDII